MTMAVQATIGIYKGKRVSIALLFSGGIAILNEGADTAGGAPSLVRGAPSDGKGDAGKAPRT